MTSEDVFKYLDLDLFSMNLAVDMDVSQESKLTSDRPGILLRVTTQHINLLCGQDYFL